MSDEASGSVPNAVFDIEPQVVEAADGPEPSLREMVKFYYANNLFDYRAMLRATDEYFAALAQAIDARSGKTGTGLIAEGDESAVTK